MERLQKIVMAMAAVIPTTQGIMAQPKDSPNPTSAVEHACTYKSPLPKDGLGSPSNLIQLPGREPGVSQLAALMRQIFDGLEAQKKILAQPSRTAQRAKLPPLVDLSKMSCVWPTDQKTRTPLFDAHAVAMNAKLATHRASGSLTTYHAVLDTCLACHQHFCHGPIDAINSLYLTAEKPIDPRSECTEDKESFPPKTP